MNDKVKIELFDKHFVVYGWLEASKEWVKIVTLERSGNSLTLEDAYAIIQSVMTGTKVPIDFGTCELIVEDMRDAVSVAQAEYESLGSKKIPTVVH